MKLDVDPDLRRARALPRAAYDADTYQRSLEAVFARSWHVVADASAADAPGSAEAAALLPGSLDEPIALARDEHGALRCLSNACTHRGAEIVRRACKVKHLRCPYHGRRFGLDGRFAHMPEMDGAEHFPSPSDDLPALPSGSWGPLHFAALDPAHELGELLDPLRERLAFLVDGRDWGAPTAREDFELEASWALYCDNYLEGFHVPFVHASLAEVLDYGAYRTEVLGRVVLQTGVAKEGEDAFALPPGHPDEGARVAAFYFWLWPATMINAYPWGLSVNLVQPLGPGRTRVRYLTWVTEPSRRGRGAGADLRRVELEDDAIVESVQRGVRSRLYRGGRFSPAREAGVHAFHRLLANALA